MHQANPAVHVGAKIPFVIVWDAFLIGVASVAGPTPVVFPFPPVLPVSLASPFLFGGLRFAVPKTIWGHPPNNFAHGPYSGNTDPRPLTTKGETNPRDKNFVLQKSPTKEGPRLGLNQAYAIMPSHRWVAGVLRNPT